MIKTNVLSFAIGFHFAYFGHWVIVRDWGAAIFAGALIVAFSLWLYREATR